MPSGFVRKKKRALYIADIVSQERKNQGKRYVHALPEIRRSQLFCMHLYRTYAHMCSHASLRYIDPDVTCPYCLRSIDVQRCVEKITASDVYLWLSYVRYVRTNDMYLTYINYIYDKL